jgi:hypothetical protein
VAFPLLVQLYVRLIFAAWLVFALMLFGLGSLTMPGENIPSGPAAPAARTR